MLQISNLRQCMKHFSGHNSCLRTCVSRYVTLSTKSTSAVTECLNNRGILRVSGKEAAVFMQGLITNDMKHLEEGAQSMYTLFLNTKGRVMYDAIIYRSEEENVFLVECDKSSLEHLQKHLKVFRVRRKIDIDVEDNLKVWVVFDPTLANAQSNEAGAISKTKDVLHGQIISSAKESNINEIVINGFENRKDIITCRDPRLSVLGLRIIAPTNEDILLKTEAEHVPSEEHKSLYRAFRYKLGIGEGVNDLPPGNCFPLEANGDYLHGISFHKGCYIGQELTARTHHTGVVRKRLMPLLFESLPQAELKLDTPIQSPSGNNKVSIGKLRGIEQNVGLALLRIAEALDIARLKIMDVTAQTMKPAWWPQEAPKDRPFSGKT